MSKIEFFKPEQFEHRWPHGTLSKEISSIANELLNQKIGPVVYGHGGNMRHMPKTFSRIGQEHTHKAYLFNIEEIKKEPCKHEPSHEYPGVYSSVCRNCGAKLVAEWKEAK